MYFNIYQISQNPIPAEEWITESDFYFSVFLGEIANKVDSVTDREERITELGNWLRQQELGSIQGNKLTLNPDMPDYKVYIFVNCFYLSDAEREVIDRKVKRDGRMAIWLYASGFANPDADVRMSADNITSLTDIHTICDPHCSFTTFRLTGAHPALSRVDADRLYGRFDRKIESNVWLRQTAQITYAYPLFTTDDPDAQVLGRFCNTGLPALVIKEMPAYTSVFCGAKVLRADILQSLLAYAGCHIWNDSTDDVLYANDHFVVLHAASAGEKTLHLPVQTDVYEVYEKRFYGQGTAAISFPMRRGETKMFSLCGEC